MTMFPSPFLSIIIPTYNSAVTLVKLLKSIEDSSSKDYEVLVVDDGSTDETPKVVKNFDLRYFRRKKSSGGPALPRNLGASYARGKILVFVDHDVILFKDTLKKLGARFKNPKTGAVVGSYALEPANPSFFSHYKSLRDYAYHTFLRNPKFRAFGFGGWISAVRSDIFKKSGGFNEKNILLEDWEFGAKLTKITPILFDTKIKVRHHFPSFGQTVKIFFRRSQAFAKLFRRKKQFYSAAATPQEALVGALAVTTIIFFGLALWKPIFGWLFLAALALEFLLNLNLWLFVFKKKGLLFLLAAFATAHFLYWVIYAGAIFSLFNLKENQ